MNIFTKKIFLRVLLVLTGVAACSVFVQGASKFDDDDGWTIVGKQMATLDLDSPFRVKVSPEKRELLVYTDRDTHLKKGGCLVVPQDVQAFFAEHQENLSTLYSYAATKPVIQRDFVDRQEAFQFRVDSPIHVSSRVVERLADRTCLFAQQQRATSPTKSVFLDKDDEVDVVDHTWSIRLLVKTLMNDTARVFKYAGTNSAGRYVQSMKIACPVICEYDGSSGLNGEYEKILTFTFEFDSATGCYRDLFHACFQDAFDLHGCTVANFRAIIDRRKVCFVEDLTVKSKSAAKKLFGNKA